MNIVKLMVIIIYLIIGSALGIIIPKNNIGGWTYPEGIQVIGVTTVHEALSFALHS
ncbi:hypothetical protein K4680_11920 [Staphylococcus aureus]|nr:hypothetical protein [Staphylococcus aureus]